MDIQKLRRESDVVLSSHGRREIHFKFLIVGDYGVGKTAFTRRFTVGKFSSSYKITVGADFMIKMLDWEPNLRIGIQLWDITGHKLFGFMSKIYYKYTVAVALIFDVSRSKTFKSLNEWLSDIRENITLQDGSNIPIVLLANKCDIKNPAITMEQIVKFCKENNISAWYFTSVKDNINVDEAMSYLVEKVLAAKVDSFQDSIRLHRESKQRNRSGCCGT